MNSVTPAFIVAGKTPWNQKVFRDIISKFPGKWIFISLNEELSRLDLKSLAPRFIFFLHWSWLVPEEIVDNYECVCFHMTDVPYGRGGSPLQNLIARGQRQTKLTALRMTRELDAGPIYFKEDLCLEGNAEEIYIRATYLSAQLIDRIIRENPQPTPQEGEVIAFTQRRPLQSLIPPELSSLEALHDFIRMLDAEGYPRAFLVHNGFRYEFNRAGLYHDRIVADVKITRLEEPLS